jgi:hypothetical protein
MFDAKEIIYSNNDLVSLIFFTIFLILAIIKIVFKERLYHTSILFSSKMYLTIYFNNEKTNVFNLFQILFFLAQLLVFSLIFYVAITYFDPTFGALNVKTFLIITSGIAIYFGIRYYLGMFLSFIFNLPKIYKILLYEKINYFNNLILWILPFLLFTIYTINYKIIFIKITLFLFIFLLIIRYILVLKNNKKLIFSNLLYFILYICALEIAPLVIILKLTI